MRYGIQYTPTARTMPVRVYFSKKSIRDNAVMAIVLGGGKLPVLYIREGV
ncbi:hypothetical protein VPH234P6_0204 [Vibrio phage 234P6]